MVHYHASTWQNHDPNDIVLAWSQSKLINYINQSLIPAAIDSTSSNGPILLCLAHHYFPEDVPNLLGLLHNNTNDSILQVALNIFEDQLSVANDGRSTDLIKYLCSVRDALMNKGIVGRSLALKQRNDGSDEHSEERHGLILGMEKIPSSPTSTITSQDRTMEEESEVVMGDRSSPLLEDISTIRNELDFIQTQMLKTTTTDKGIQDLEQRSRGAEIMLEKISRDTNRGLSCDESIRTHIEHLVLKYKAVYSWVTDVRIWFTEAERIRLWIQGKIEILELNPLLSGLNEISLDCTTDDIERLTAEHEAMEKEIEHFDKEDMTRLRAHVKLLTTERDPDKELSPADTTTIEITFTTLTTLDRLTHLLRRRTSALKKLTLRVFWEEEYKVTVEWVMSMEKSIRHFVRYNAWWNADDDQPSTEEVIAILLDLEQQVATFDQGQFTKTVTMYENLDRSSSVELPRHLETRQVKVEKDFESLTIDIKHARLIVEHRLAIVALLNHMDQMKAVGEQLYNTIDTTSKEPAENEELSWKFFEEQVLCFQFEVKAMLKDARLPNAPHDKVDFLGNLTASQVQDLATANFQEKSHSLITLAGALDRKLVSYKTTILLSARAEKLKQKIRHALILLQGDLQSTPSHRVSLEMNENLVTSGELNEMTKQKELLVEKVAQHRALVNSLECDVTALETDIKEQDAVVSLDSIRDSYDQAFEHIEALEALLKSNDMNIDLQRNYLMWRERYNQCLNQLDSFVRDIEILSCESQWKIHQADAFSDTKKEQIDLQTRYDSAILLAKEILEQHLPQADTAFEALDLKLDSDSNSHQAKQNIKTSHHGLRERAKQLDTSLQLCRVILDQRTAIESFISRVTEIRSTGQELLNALEKLNDGPLEKDSNEIGNTIDEYDRSVTDLWQDHTNNMTYSEQGQHEERSKANDAIKVLIQSRYDDLLEQSRMIHIAKSKVDTSAGLKKSLHSHMKDATKLQEKIVSDKERVISGEQIDQKEKHTMLLRAYEYEKEAKELVSYENTLRLQLTDLPSTTLLLDNFQSLTRELVELSFKHRMHLDWENQWEKTREELAVIQDTHSTLMRRMDACNEINEADALISDAGDLEERLAIVVSQDWVKLSQLIKLMREIPMDVEKRQQEIADSLHQTKDRMIKGQTKFEELKTRLFWKRDMAGTAVDRLMARCTELECDIQSVAFADDQQITKWKKEDSALYACLKEIECSALEIMGKDHPDSAETIRKSKDRYEDVHEKLETAIVRAQQHQAENQYRKSAKLLKSTIYEIQKGLQALRTEYGIVYGSATEAEVYTVHCTDMEECYQKLNQEFERDILGKQEKVLLLYQQYQSTDAPKKDDIVAMKKELEDELSSLNVVQKSTKELVESVSWWCNLHIKLSNIEKSLSNAMSATTAKEGLQNAGATRAELEELLRESKRRLENDQDNENATEFRNRIEAVCHRVSCTIAQATLQGMIAKSKQETESIQLRRETIDKLQIDTGSTRLESIYREMSRGNTTSQTKYDDLGKTLASLKENTKANEEALFIPMQKEQSVLKAALNDEKELAETLRFLVGLTKAAESISSWIDSCKKTIKEISDDVDTLCYQDARSQVDDVQQKMDKFDKESIQAFLQLQDKTPGNNRPLHCKLNECMRWKSDSVKEACDETHRSLDELKHSVEKRAQTLVVARKMKQIIASLGSLRDKVERWDLPSSSGADHRDISLTWLLRAPQVKAIQDQEEVANASMVRLGSDIAELDALIADYDDKMGSFEHQRTEIGVAEKYIHSVLQDKQKAIAEAALIAKYLMIADDTQVLLNSLDEAVQMASKSHVKMIGDKYSRADLQAKLIELGARQRYYDDKIKQKLDEAALSIPEGNFSMLSNHLKEMHNRWKEILRRAQDSKNELNRAMMSSAEPLAPRVRKSSLPTRKATTLPRDTLPPTPSLPADMLPSSNSPTGFRSASPASIRLASSSSASRIPSYSPGRSSSARPKQPSKSATSSRSKAPVIQVTRPATPNEYVADPDNDLDMEIGRIVNEAPYRVKVKMVPGDVGRYWFGEANPKLAYCRVLKSKMVMVRVGGGWTELSQFLRDHALLESELVPASGVTPVTLSSTSTTATSSPLLQEGFIKTRRDRSVSPSRSSQTEHGRGYKDGDKYITVDRFGNQMEVKMVAEKSKQGRHRPPATRTT